MQSQETTGIHIEGHIKIWDPVSSEVYINKRNAIHYENISIALANSLANSGNGFVYEMAFGNGGTAIDPTGIITYLTPNSSGSNASLYNGTYSKVVNQNSSTNVDPSRNYVEVRHVTGTNYSDIFVTCLLDYGDGNNSGQLAFDNSTNTDGSFVFDELGLKSYSPSGNSLLLTHVIFHPVQKSLNRLIQIDYTVRIQSLTGLVGV
jgi:hypothetical protein